MSKYAPLAEFLAEKRGTEVPVTFEEMEQFLGFALPPSCQYPAWWSNNRSNSVMTNVWMDAGWKTKNVDTERRKLTFVRMSESELRAESGSKIKEKVYEDVPSDAELTLDLGLLDGVSLGVLRVLARRNRRSVQDEVLSLIKEAL